jgi:hypothetical protein
MRVSTRRVVIVWFALLGAAIGACVIQPQPLPPGVVDGRGGNDPVTGPVFGDEGAGGDAGKGSSSGGAGAPTSFPGDGGRDAGTWRDAAAATAVDGAAPVDAADANDVNMTTDAADAGDAMR